MSGGLTLLLTSPRVPGGLLTLSAWQALSSADQVLARDGHHEQADALATASIPLQRSGSEDPRALARELVEAARERQVVWLGSADGDPGLTDALAAELSRVAVGEDPPAVEVLVGSHDATGARLLDLVAVMDRLRSPGGCPWDAAQTHQSLTPYLLEEAYEAVEAIEAGDRSGLAEELGDVLLQVVFHARLAQEDEQAPFDIDDVAAGIVAKLVRRHPHVFAASESSDATTPEHVEANWDRIKTAEKGRDSVLDGVPVALPALSRADAVLGRLSRAGLSPDRATAAGGAGDGRSTLTSDPAEGWDEQAVGGTLLDVVERARGAGIDPEAALRSAVRRLEADARRQEADAQRLEAAR